MPALWQQLLAGILGIPAILLIAWCGAHLHFGRHEAVGNKNVPESGNLPGNNSRSSLISAPDQTAKRSTAQTLSVEADGIVGNRERKKRPGPKREGQAAEADREARKQKRLQRLKSTEGAPTEQKGLKRREGETEEEFEARKKRIERRLAKQRAARAKQRAARAKQRAAREVTSS